MYLYRSATVDRMWEILSAHAPFTALIPASRRIVPDGTGWLKDAVLKSPSDFPTVRVRLGNNSQVRPFPQRTFSTEAGQLDMETDSGDIPAAADFEMRIIYRDVAQGDDTDFRDDLEGKAMAALIEAGPLLDNASGTPLSRVTNIGLIRSLHSSAMVNGSMRPITTITIPVQYELDGSDLLPD